jgi:hypothetical protein
MNRNRSRPPTSCKSPFTVTVRQHGLSTTTATNEQIALERVENERVEKELLSLEQNTRTTKLSRAFRRDAFVFGDKKTSPSKKPDQKSTLQSPYPSKSCRESKSFPPRPQNWEATKGLEKPCSRTKKEGSLHSQHPDTKIPFSTAPEDRTWRKMPTNNAHLVSGSSEDSVDQHLLVSTATRLPQTSHSMNASTTSDPFHLYRRESMQVRVKRAMRQQTQRSMPNIFLGGTVDDEIEGPIKAGGNMNSHPGPEDFRLEAMWGNKGSHSLSRVGGNCYGPAQVQRSVQYFQNRGTNRTFHRSVLPVELCSKNQAANDNGVEIALDDLVGLLEESNSRDRSDEHRLVESGSSPLFHARSLCIEELADVLHYVILFDDLKADVKWDTIARMASRDQVVEDPFKPLDSIEFFEGDDNFSEVSTIQ